jgi:cell division protease FtsH
MGNAGKNIFFWVVIFVLVIISYDLMNNNKIVGKGVVPISFSEFSQKIDSKEITDVTIQGNNVKGTFSDGDEFTTIVPDNYPGLIDNLKESGVKIDVKSRDSKANSIFGILLSWFPLLLLVGVWVYFMRQMQGSGNKAMGFSKSKARLLNQDENKVTFKDVAGVEEAKEELIEIVDFLKNPLKFQDIGGKIPKGCLLIGPPGTGKTLLARAIAGEANVPFFTISGSDFVEMFVGVGASRVRDMFEQGKKSAPCIIFIDEIDAVGRHRGIGVGGGNDEREQTLNQLLVEMDGFQSNSGIIIIAATNRPDVLDPALLRPGRFDRQIVVPMPDMVGRVSILNVHLKNIKKAPNVDSTIIARGTPGFSGADLANLVNEGALLAARRNKRVVTMDELEAAKDKVMMGSERKSLKMDEEEKKLTAYHEGGHALIAYYQPASDPIHKATIIPRGRALGMVMRLPEKDKFSVTREKLKADLAVAMGGRVAELIIFGYDKVTSGASSDIEQATKIARAMVSEWGMSEKVGPLFHGNDNNDHYYPGASKQKSVETSNLIDNEVKSLIEEAYNKAETLIKKHIKQLHSLAEALLKYETLSGDEVMAVIQGKKIRQEYKHENTTDHKPKSSVPTTKKIIPLGDSKLEGETA